MRPASILFAKNPGLQAGLMVEGAAPDILRGNEVKGCNE